MDSIFAQVCRAKNFLLVVAFGVVPPASSKVFRAVHYGHIPSLWSSGFGNHVSDFEFEFLAHTFSFL
jgi:hypothetical protein